ncbi:hypothetical protein K8M07_03185 [Schnuerera sp. xch1]|uniref:hypothetical protein n=1 Tax=Schnuerera sp. xch1 TaxID=2874283 RepID=UPI001CBF2AA7|nr:hypothetical protein [Schnuerera sp. xch1]MBZ2174245.1 hypothetical protein [Schnuerera sp. xch1]
MEKVKQSLIFNLSNQANTFKCRKSFLSQFNIFTIFGLEYLNTIKAVDKIPISISVDKDGGLSIDGIDEELINDKNIYVYTDKKVTKSD